MIVMVTPSRVGMLVQATLRPKEKDKCRQTRTENALSVMFWENWYIREWTVMAVLYTEK